jgi:hypothetical protein
MQPFRTAAGSIPINSLNKSNIFFKSLKVLGLTRRTREQKIAEISIFGCLHLALSSLKK